MRRKSRAGAPVTDREVVMAAAMSGLSNDEIAARNPHIKLTNLRQYAAMGRRVQRNGVDRTRITARISNATAAGLRQEAIRRYGSADHLESMINRLLRTIVTDQLFNAVLED